MRNKLEEVAVIVFFLVVNYLLSLVHFSVGPVIITMQSLGAMLAGALLGSRKGFLVTLIYPISMYTKVVGVSGGFLVSLPIAAYFIGLVVEKYGSHKKTIIKACIVFGVVFVYIIGVLWYEYVGILEWKDIYLFNCIPYIFCEAVKVLITVFITDRFAYRPIA